MRRYLRPLGFLKGRVAAEAIAAELAIPLGGGSLAFTLVEVIDRVEPGEIRREMRAASTVQIPASLTGRRDYDLDCPEVMGIVNPTPDSFSDGRTYLDPGRAIAHAEAMILAGAKIIDIGGESTRPGAEPVAVDEEMRRVLPVIAGIRDRAAAAGVTISIDTRNAVTMQAALDAGAGMINDVTALTHDPASVGVAARSGAKVVLMHMQGDPRTMQLAPAYEDVVLDIYDYLEARVAAAVAAGIARSRLVIDPGIGFGKSVAHNLALIDQVSLFHGLGLPVLIGASRKGLIARLSADEPADQRLGGSLALELAAVAQGAQILRVHDVAETLQALRIAEAIGAN